MARIIHFPEKSEGVTGTARLIAIDPQEVILCEHWLNQGYSIDGVHARLQEHREIWQALGRIAENQYPKH